MESLPAEVIVLQDVDNGVADELLYTVSLYESRHVNVFDGRIGTMITQGDPLYYIERAANVDHT
jgi:hypothetical protein